MTAARRHLLIVGCGDTGVRVAARAVGAGTRVTAIVRSEASADRARAAGATVWRCDLDSDDAIETLSPLIAAADHLLYSAPPPGMGNSDETSDPRMARVLAACAGRTPHLVYIGTSGVYGNHGGAWIDEDTPVDPSTPRAARRLDAERQLRAAIPEAILLRVPGIYGPNRLPVDRVRAGEPVLAADDDWTNRIHIDDLATIVWRALVEDWPQRLYNACDGRPTPRTDYYDTLAELLGVDAPPRIGWAEAEQRFSAMRLSFLAESRRLSNARLVADTGYRFLFADYRDGLIASLRGEPETD